MSHSYFCRSDIFWLLNFKSNIFSPSVHFFSINSTVQKEKTSLQPTNLNNSNNNMVKWKFEAQQPVYSSNSFKLWTKSPYEPTPRCQSPIDVKSFVKLLTASWLWMPKVGLDGIVPFWPIYSKSSLESKKSHWDCHRWSLLWWKSRVVGQRKWDLVFLRLKKVHLLYRGKLVFLPTWSLVIGNNHYKKFYLKLYSVVNLMGSGEHTRIKWIDLGHVNNFFEVSLLPIYSLGWCKFTSRA